MASINNGATEQGRRERCGVTGMTVLAMDH
jgi:hypothetical protein